MEISFQSHFSKFMIHHWRKSDFFNNTFFFETNITMWSNHTLTN